MVTAAAQEDALYWSHANALVVHDEYDDDIGLNSGYETCDSVEEVRAERRKHKNSTPARAPAIGFVAGWSAVLSQSLVVIQHTLLVAAVVICFFLVAGVMWGPLTNTVTTILDSAAYSSPCFQSSANDDVSHAWTERCANVAATCRLLSCPAGGSCQGGELPSCGPDNISFAAFEPKSNGQSCGLTPGAIFVYNAINNRLKVLPVSSMCFESPSIKVRNHGSSTPSSVMFDFYDLVTDLQRSTLDSEVEKLTSPDTLAWLQYAVDRQIVKGVTMEQTAKKSVLIGLSPESLDQLSLPSNCIAQRAILSSMGSMNSLIWQMVIKWCVSFIWSVSLQQSIAIPMLLYCGRKFLYWCFRKFVAWCFGKMWLLVLSSSA